ncbi:MAG: hypothetical protein HY344_02650 [Candidatus Levybacteria bacterium]|nr:hypothetical protein [Candidatus Levybacteria bacterium]
MLQGKSIHYQKLLQKWGQKHSNLQKEIFDKHKEAFDWLENNSKQLAVGSITGLFLLTSPIIPQIPASFSAEVTNPQPVDKRVFLVYDLKSVLPPDVRPLTTDEESKVSEVFARTFGINAIAQLSGKRLNSQYGYIGQEQHLARFPGDNMFMHFDTPQEALEFGSYGMAPGLGAFRYFANSRSEMTGEDNLREKYYIAVQTFLSPGFNEKTKEYMDFYKYRKMLVVNPQNGKAVVAVIGDSGPAAWTGKQLGGSPEVMRYLERVDGRGKGPVLYFFVDDPENKVPLGPVSL